MYVYIDLVKIKILMVGPWEDLANKYLDNNPESEGIIFHISDLKKQIISLGKKRFAILLKCHKIGGENTKEKFSNLREFILKNVKRSTNFINVTEKMKMAKSSKKTSKPVEKEEVKKAVKKAAKSEKVINNGITRPGEGTATGRVWEIADAIYKKTKKVPEVAKVVEQGEKEGLNSSTIKIQFVKWKKFNDLAEAPKKKKDEKEEKPVKKDAGKKSKKVEDDDEEEDEDDDDEEEEEDDEDEEEEDDEDE